LHLDAPISAGKSVMWEYIGLVIGDISSGILSQYFRSRKKVVGIYVLTCAALVAVYLFVPLYSSALFYGLCILLGITAGYWALFVTVAAEQFGTNLRATVATTVPNFVRGSILVMTPLFLLFKEQLGILLGTGLLSVLAIGVSLLGLWKMEETFAKDLNFLEQGAAHGTAEETSETTRPMPAPTALPK
jgi:MFS family permease